MIMIALVWGFYSDLAVLVYIKTLSLAMQGSQGRSGAGRPDIVGLVNAKLADCAIHHCFIFTTQASLAWVRDEFRTCF